MIVLGSKHVDSPIKIPLWAVKVGPVTCFVRVSDPVLGSAALSGPTLCGRRPTEGIPPKWKRLAKPTEKTCQTCAARACSTPTRIVWR